MAEDRSNSMENKVDHKSDQPCELSYKFLKKITNDFDESLIVGSGTFGIVYKGTCENGEKIAVKVLKNTSGFETTEEFHKELKNLRRLKHQNVVKLVGFCNESEKVVAEYNGNQVIAEKRHTSLCFEYVCNGSLAKHIHADGCSGLNWHILYKIIKGICQGLEYLRHGLEFSVWHLDLKPANILLDNNMIPKLADFGLSKLLFGDENTRKTINHVGTGGYLPPEYIERGLLTKEFDIFALGVIIAKLMAGREVYSEIDNMSEKKFINCVHGNWRKKLSETLAPSQLEVYCEQVRTCIKIALKCMNRNRQERPGIQFIVSNLIETEILIRTRGLQTEQTYLGAPIIIYARERLARTLGSRVRTVRILKVALRPDNILSLHFSKPHGFRYSSGQYIFIKCAAVSSFQWHPFSIMSAPDDDYVSVHIKTCGNWTSELKKVFIERCLPPAEGNTEIRREKYNYNTNPSFPKVLIDGPYGAPAQDYKQYDVVLLVGLGIGATPMISIIKDIINNMKRLDGDVESGDGAGVSLTSSFRTRQAYFYWVTLEQGSKWFRGVLDELAAADEKGVIELHSHCSNGYEEGRWGLVPMFQSLNHAKDGVDDDVVDGTRVKTHYSRPDWSKVYERIALRHVGQRVGVFYCGESVLTEELRNLAKDFSTNTNTKFEFHRENFF